ncbi:MAG: IS66 family transposase [Acidobacteriota bacterium]
MTVVSPKDQKLIDELRKRNRSLELENKILREEIALLRQHMFGRRTERIQPGQLGLFSDDGLEEAAAEVASSLEKTSKSSRKPKGHGRASFPAHLPRETVVCSVPEEQRSCPDCGKPMQGIGVEVTERGHLIPARLVVRRFEREKLACPAGHTVITANAPDPLVRRCKYEPSVYAHVAVSKYQDHLPLNRLQGIFKRHGVQIPKQTMWDMLVTVDELLAQPVLEQAHKEILESGVLLSDESPIRMRLEDGKGSRETTVWAWRSLREEIPRKVLVRFEISKSRDGPKRFLGDWKGVLVSDGTSLHDEVARSNGIVRAGCWAHARRYFRKAFDVGTRAAGLCLAPINRLFWIERAVNERADRLGLDLAARRELRAAIRARRSAVVVRKLYETANSLAQHKATLPRGQLGKALGYLENQREPLEVFLSDPRIPLSNNDSERELRHIVVGRANWMVFASPRGGEVACRLYSLVLSCKENGVDPLTYIEDALSRISTTPASRIAELTPWGWAAARAAEASRQES